MKKIIFTQSAASPSSSPRRGKREQSRQAWVYARPGDDVNLQTVDMDLDPKEEEQLPSARANVFNRSQEDS